MMESAFACLAVFCFVEYVNHRCMMKTYEDMYEKMINVYKDALRDSYRLIDKLTDEEEDE